MVRFKLRDNMTVSMSDQANFNPTMVRLKLQYHFRDKYMKYLFQSHNGSIKTYERDSYEIDYYEFQSHNGSIKTLWLQIYI